MGKRKEGVHPISQSEGFAHIENYYRSGLSPSAYYKQHGLTECQFYGWRKRYLAIHPQADKRPTPVKAKKQFHPVRTESATDIRLSGMEIRYPNGVRIVIANDRPIEITLLSELIKLWV
jgi:hypothetical protein